jgi:hypothetical protein
MREQAVGHGHNSKHNQQTNSNEYVTPSPDGRLTFTASSRAAIDSQALQVFVFCVNRHEAYK